MIFLDYHSLSERSSTRFWPAQTHLNSFRIAHGNSPKCDWSTQSGRPRFQSGSCMHAKVQKKRVTQVLGLSKHVPCWSAVTVRRVKLIAVLDLNFGAIHCVRHLHVGRVFILPPFTCCFSRSSNGNRKASSHSNNQTTKSNHERKNMFRSASSRVFNIIYRKETCSKCGNMSHEMWQSFGTLRWKPLWFTKQLYTLSFSTIRALAIVKKCGFVGLVTPVKRLHVNSPEIRHMSYHKNERKEPFIALNDYTAAKPCFSCKAVHQHLVVVICHCRQKDQNKWYIQSLLISMPIFGLSPIIRSSHRYKTEVTEETSRFQWSWPTVWIFLGALSTSQSAQSAVHGSHVCHEHACKHLGGGTDTEIERTRAGACSEGW